MIKIQSFPSQGLLFLLLAMLAACSPLTPQSTLPAPPDNQVEIADFDSMYDSSVTIVETEEVLNEELAALDQLGSWKESKHQEQIDEYPEIVYDFPITINKQVELYLDLFQNKQRKYFKRWLARSGKYLPTIQQELKKAGLPQDLAYLAMIESGFNPSAYSHAHASGLWQFIKGTGRNYGLRIDSWVDERRNPEKATKAAIAYLSNLHAMFDDWYLAVAGYNAGEGKVERAIKKYNTRDFWELAQHRYLRLETKRYVPKLIAAIIIAREPEKYGFTSIDYQQPVEFDLVQVPPRTDLAAVATASNTSVKKLRTLNNELRKSQTPPGLEPYQLCIPSGTRELVTSNLSRLHPVITTGYKTHTVRKGDTLSRICATYKLNKTTLLKANRLRSARLSKDQRLRIPYRTTKYVLLKDGETPESRFANAGKAGQMTLHQIKKGETLSKISKQYSIPVEIIIQWNNISDVRKIRAGRHLALYMDSPSKAAGMTVAASTQTDTSLLMDRKKLKAYANTSTSEVTWYRVRSGDSLWTIARKFRVSTHDIRRWNNLASSRIQPGKRLVVSL
ncbi:MAG: LysM peptidoglycan-binding domain-containing protein [Desulfobulbaceae bacterium]|nr:LysM peptidoglycan-binding domain-containing protein [Desulfobulbaceae bacterium]